ncbi:hypothetical protein DPMN_127872 [Dreissena polymorpha]|uniref:Uncharacterized protein n=1 Tax=Dreissena polymorpha TaxID=45954 RepID=A0A9D4GZS7_DREPO|nr:hypothetical protein DPMN_127872 [Dreissena polymorpha]
MPRRTGPQVVHPQGAVISRGFRKLKKERKGSQCQPQQNKSSKRKIEECTEASWNIKRSMRAEKRNKLETLTTEEEEAAHQNRTKDLYVCQAREASKGQK